MKRPRRAKIAWKKGKNEKQPILRGYMRFLGRSAFTMMYEYITLADETVITHSDIIDRNGIKTIEVHFERAKHNGFDSARCVLPAYQWKFRDGFTDEEMDFFVEFLRHNSHLLFSFAEQGGIGCA